MNSKAKKLVKQLEEEAELYLQECLDNTTEKLANTGKIVEVVDRHIPTIDYFINIHLLLTKKQELISRRTFYNWLNSVDPVPDKGELTPKQELQRIKLHTIKRIDLKFKALATDIVANEGKGIFYAKNRLGMTDKIKTDETHQVTHTVLNLGAGVKPPGEEKPPLKKVFILPKKTP